jgi:transcriptional regulator with XRE-family HTH domain
MRSYGPEIRRRRREKELTHADVAAASGIAVATLIDVEKKRLGILKSDYEKVILAIEELPAKQRVAA